MKKYIVLFPDTFLWFNDLKGVLYNCKEAIKLEFDCNSLIYNYCSLLDDMSNLYSVEITEDDMKNQVFINWINNIEEYKVGKIYKCNPLENKPFSLPPIINLRNEIEDQQSNETSYTDLINIDSCLNEITIFLGGKALDDDRNLFFKQILYPINSDCYLDYEILNKFLLTSRLNSVCKFNLICSEILNYPDLKRIINFLESYGILINYYLNTNDINDVCVFLTQISSPKSMINIYFNDKESFQIINSYLLISQFDYNWIFIIENETEYLLAEELVTVNNIKNSEFWPIYSGNNKSFFKENVFISQFEINNLQITKQNIFSNKIINSNFFGQLFILPNKDVHTNLNKPRLGTIDENIMDIVSYELNSSDSSWKCVRSKLKPCKDCLYSFLCPPPSNYEFFIGKFNLCNISS